MSVLKTFVKGGIHPPDHKLSAGKPIQNLPLPKQITVLVSQHIGAPPKLLVKRGDQVKTGQLLAESGGFVSANTHSPATGKVAKIDSAMDSSGYRKPAILIDTEETDEWEEGILTDTVLDKNIQLNGGDIIQKIMEKGLVGLGGATFPSHVKLSVPKGKTAEYLVINGVECEPYLTADHALMMEKSDEIMVGIQILMKGVGVESAIIGIENNKQDAIEKLTRLAPAYKGISIQPLKTKYPQGGEKQLIKAILNREVPPGGLPIDVGAVVFNVGTVYASYEAVQKNKPLIERIVTVTGKSVKVPANFRVRIGTPSTAVLDAAGGLPEDTGKIISGGPMMGRAIPGTEIPITKGSSGLLILRNEEAKREKIIACIRCTKCVQVCPMYLEPYLLQTLSEKDLTERMEQERILDCVECGSCSYICPSNRPLLDYIRLGKSKVTKIIRSRKK